jgi:hypothetical protein
MRFFHGNAEFCDFGAQNRVLRFAQNCNKKCRGVLNQVPDLVRQQEHSDDLSSDTTLSNISRPSRNRVSIPRNHVIADQ